MPSHFLGIYVALYEYTPQSDQELPLKEGDLLYVLEKGEDEWWKAKKRTLFTDEDEPEGLVPCNYIEEAKVISKAKATYDYTRQTQEEISFTEEAILDVYDTQDPDWTLVGYNGEYGFAPANYIEVSEQQEEAAPAPAPAPIPVPIPEAAGEARPTPTLTLSARPHSPSPIPPSPGIAPPDLEKPLPTPQPDYDDPPPTPPRPVSVVGASSNNRLSMPPRQASQQGYSPNSNNSRSPRMQQPSPRHARFAGYSDSDSDDGPSLPVKRPPHERRAQRQQDGYVGEERLHPVDPGSPGHIPPGYRTFPVAELIGKKKHAALLALGPDRIILIPDKSTLPRQEWSVENMANYSVEGKHVFIDCHYPAKAMDLHAGSKEGAAEIFSALGEINGAARAAGLREVLSAAENKYKRSEAIGTILWDFVAGGQDEVSVAAGDEVTILDDKDTDWWLVKRTVNGEEGVVPSSYVERGRADIAASIDGKTKDVKNRNSVHSGDHSRMNSSASLPSGVQLPVRTTSLATKRQGGEAQSSKSKPDPSKLRTWTDRSKTFKVEAQFLGCRDGKIHLHKSNGVKIAVPVAKMSVEDLEYVERITGLSLDEDKPLSYVKSQQGQQTQQQRPQQPKPQSGITIEKPSSGASQDKKPEYDWFDFFLGCGIDLGQCQRYAHNFQKENMDETFLPELTAGSMRSLGMKEGDIIRATKFLDNKYNRNGGADGGKKAVSFGGAEVIGENGGEGSSGGLFSGPGGVLRNNTGRKGRPAPAVVTSDTVDPNAFLPKPSPPPASKSSYGGGSGGFEDDAWAPKPLKQPPQPQKPVEPPKPATPPPAPKQPTPPPPAPAPVVHPDIAGLSLDTPPLQPSIVNPPPQPQPSISPQPSFAAQARQRPAAPSSTGATAGSLIPPPPQRPISAPQTFQPNQMGGAPLQPQLTGLPLTSAAPPGQLSMADQLHNMRMAQIQQQQESLAQTQRMILAQMTGASPLVAHATGLTQHQQANIPPQQPSGFMNGLPTLQQPQPQMPQQSFQSLINQPTGMMQQPTGMMQQPMIQQPTGMMGQPGMPGMMPQNTGMGMNMGMTGPGMVGMRGPGQPVTLPVNSLLPPALVPQQTGFMQPLQPLKPQATGPPPPVRFGVQPGAPKLAPQQTGRKANLSQATPENPFGF